MSGTKSGPTTCTYSGGGEGSVEEGEQEERETMVLAVGVPMSGVPMSTALISPLVLLIPCQTPPQPASAAPSSFSWFPSSCGSLYSRCHRHLPICAVRRQPRRRELQGPAAAVAWGRDLADAQGLPERIVCGAPGPSLLHGPLRLHFREEARTGEMGVVMVMTMGDGGWLLPERKRFPQRFRGQIG